MSYDKLVNWISSQKDTLDGIIEQSAYNYYNANRSLGNIVFDINETSKECYSLSQGKDLCYDRPSIGLSYSLWYQGRRVNTFLNYFAQIIYDARNEKTVNLFDLGAGTGAVQWAAALVVSGLKELNIIVPEIKIINIDTSPFMLDYNRTYLWPEFLKNYPFSKSLNISYSLNSWNETNFDMGSNNWITASYLFDHSENIEDLTINFLELIQTYKPSKILLLSSYNKRHLTNEVGDLIKENNYASLKLENKLLFSGIMPKTKRAREEFKQKLNINFSGTPTWNDAALFGSVLKSNQPIFYDLFEDNTDKIDLYNPPITVRRNIVLNPKQRIAATPDGKPTIITGPAGCGKSVVITERVVILVEQALKERRIEKLSILVTTFNKELKAYLIKWLTDILESKRIEYSISTNGIRIAGSKFANIAIMHFDILPYRIWQAKSPHDFPFTRDQLHFDALHKRIAQEAIAIIKEKEKITISEYDNVLNPEYVLDEYHRIIYGNEYTKEEIYLTSIRRGRPVLQYNGIRRKLLFKTIIKYLEILEQRNYSSIITRRNKFLKKLNTGSINGLFQHIFVDEFQDCTQADYSIFYKLLKSPNNLVIAGDYAQAIHLGKSASIPRDKDETTPKMRNFKKHILEGSYRLPYRISEAIQPISDYIKTDGQDDSDVITPYKGAPPGARPLLVFAENDEDMASKILQIVDSYKLFDIINLSEVPPRNITILEKDTSLQRSLIIKKGNIAFPDTILRLKGMEKNCILWSTKIEITDADEIYNFVYTIMTRTSGILIIAIYNNINYTFKEVINLLRKDRIIIWDDLTKAHLKNHYELI